MDNEDCNCDYDQAKLGVLHIRDKNESTGKVIKGNGLNCPIDFLGRERSLFLGSEFG